MKRKLAENWKRIEQRVAEACHRAGRDPSSITIVAATKYASMDIIRALVDIGVRDLGENQVQELTKRAAMVKEWLCRPFHGSSVGERLPPRWHMIGHLQRNKVKQVLPWVGLIHSVDTLRLAEEIDARSRALGCVSPVLLEVNAGDERSKHGVAVAATTHMAEQIHSLQHIKLRGLMAIAPLTDDQQRIRSVFSRVRELFEEIIGQRLCGPEFRELSLGMSNDFEHGIASGATFVRIGSALYEGIEIAPQPASVD